MKNSSFIRDLLVKVLLIVIFVLLLMYLFPMPNLSPFYSSIFNDNIQTMKDAAEDYYTTERMPKEEGKSTKMTLQEMIDKKLIIPFVDKDGKQCNAKKSYVQVTKGKDEYELKVSLTCGTESDYIIEHIGCYNFCPTGNCTLAEAKKAEEQQAQPVQTKTDSNGNVTVVVPTGRYITEYEYSKTLYDEKWTLGDWRNTKVSENDNVKLVDTRTQYTGQKKVVSGTKLYEQKPIAWKDNWTYDEEWTTESKTQTDTLKLWKERTLYTGQKKVESKITEYRHDKYVNKDNWTFDEDWTTDVKTQTANLKLWKERTLYTGQKKVENKTTEYKHVKYQVTDNWKETGWSTTKRTESDNTKLIGTRYTVTKDITTTDTTCTGSTVDSTWYYSKPADTSSRVYNSTPVDSKTTESWKVIADSEPHTTTMSTYIGDRWYELISQNDTECLGSCNGNAKQTIYYYRVYQKVYGHMYKYSYCTPKTSSTTKTDTQVVTNLKEWTDKGYKLTKTEYNYKVKNTTKEVVDTKWTTSKTSPAGYEYANDTRTKTTVSYESLGKWVTNENKLGEYTYNVQTVKQYKYAYNNPTRVFDSSVWTTSKTSPAGYEYANKTRTKTSVTYEALGKWVTSYDKLGEYTINVKTIKQYKYAHNTRTKYLKDEPIYTTENVARSGYELTGKTKETTKTTYVDLGSWVNSKSELGEYTYNIQTRTQYRYKYRDVTSHTETKWATENPGNGFTPTGNSRKKYIQTGYTTNKQK